MAIDDKIKNEKLQYDISRETAKISALSSGKIDKYEYLTGEEILPFHQSRIIEQHILQSAKHLKNNNKKKTIEYQGIKQVEALKVLKPEGNRELETIGGIFPKIKRNNEIENELDKIK